MEEYENKVNYLRHLKKIANIKQVNRRNNPLSTIFNHSAQSNLSSMKKTNNHCPPRNVPESETEAKTKLIKAQKESCEISTLKRRIPDC